MYDVLLDKVERLTLVQQQSRAVYLAAGHDVDEPWPDLELAQATFDAALEAEPDAVDGADAEDRELLTLLGL